MDDYNTQLFLVGEKPKPPTLKQLAVRYKGIYNKDTVALTRLCVWFESIKGTGSKEIDQ